MSDINATGLGPAAGGFNPSGQDIMDMGYAKAMTYEAMQDYARSLPEHETIMARLLEMQGKNMSRAERARIMYGTSRGAAAEMAAMFAENRFLQQKYGGIANTSATYSQMFSSGIGVNVEGGGINGVGRMIGNGRITTALQEQFVRQVNQQVFGDSMDPRNNYGVNAEGVSTINAWYAQKMGLGPAGTLRRGLTGEQALDSRLASAPEDQRELLLQHKKAIQGMGDKESREYFKRQAKVERERGDVRMASSLEGLSTQTESVEVNEKYVKMSADITKKISKSLSQLKDIYGNLSNPELLMKMETLAGSGNAGQQAATVDKLINIAKGAGIDPRNAFRDLTNPYAAAQGIQRLGTGFGMTTPGERLVDPNKNLGALNEKIRNGVFSRVSGSSNFNPPNADFDKGQYLTDASNAITVAASTFDRDFSRNTISTALGYADARGDTELGDKIRGIVSGMGGMTTQQQVGELNKLQDLLGKNGLNLAQTAGTATGLQYASKMTVESSEALIDATASRTMDAAKRYLTHPNTGFSKAARAVLDKDGKPVDPKTLAQNMLTQLGVPGLTDLTTGTKTPAEVAKFFQDNGVGADVQKLLTNPDGSLNRTAITDIQKTLEPHMATTAPFSQYARRQGAAERVNKWRPDAGTMFGEGGSTLSNIIGFAISKDGEKLYSSDEYRMQALLGAGKLADQKGVMKVEDYKNMTGKELQALQGLSTVKGFDLLKEFGVKSMDELAEKTKGNDEMRLKVLSALSQKGGLEFSRTAGTGAVAINKEQLRSEENNRTMKRIALAGTAASVLGIPSELMGSSAVIKGIMEKGAVTTESAGTGLNVHNAGAITLNGKEVVDATSFTNKWKHASMHGIKEVDRQIKTISGMNDAQINDLSSLNEMSGGKIKEGWEKQRAELAATIKAIDAGKTPGLVDADDNNTVQSRDKLQEMLSGIDTVLKKLGGANPDKATIVENMTVTGNITVKGKLNQE